RLEAVIGLGAEDRLDRRIGADGEEGRLELANLDLVLVVQQNLRVIRDLLIVDIRAIAALFVVLDEVAVVDAKNPRVPAAHGVLFADHLMTIGAAAQDGDVAVEADDVAEALPRVDVQHRHVGLLGQRDTRTFSQVYRGDHRRPQAILPIFSANREVIFSWATA